MIKNFVLDTNVVVHSPMAIYMFEDNNVILPLIVLEELDNLKTREGVIGYQARAAIKEINKARQCGNIRDGIKLPNGGTLRVELNHMDAVWIPDGFDIEKNDNKILTIAYNLHTESMKQGIRTILVTKDVCVAIKAESLGIEAQDYHNDWVDIDKLYKGYRNITMSSDEINDIYRSGLELGDMENPPYPNEFLCIKSIDNVSHECLARYDGSTVVPLQYANVNPWGLVPRNKEQKMALELLMDDSIPFTTLLGGAGVRKTLLAVAVALHKVLDEGKYDKIIFVKPVNIAGDPIGFLPGDERKKLAPFMQSFGDAIQALMSDKSKNTNSDKGNKLLKNAKKSLEYDENKLTFSVESFLETYREAGVIEMKTFAFMRGRTLSNAFVIVDEAQQITPHLAKLMLTRAGRGSKFVMLGDASDNQIDNIHLDSKSNGLVYVVDKMRPSKITGHVTLDEVERSPLAAIAEEFL